MKITIPAAIVLLITSAVFFFTGNYFWACLTLFASCSAISYVAVFFVFESLNLEDNLLVANILYVESLIKMAENDIDIKLTDEYITGMIKLWESSPMYHAKVGNPCYTLAVKYGKLLRIRKSA